MHRAVPLMDTSIVVDRRVYHLRCTGPCRWRTRPSPLIDASMTLDAPERAGWWTRASPSMHPSVPV